MRADLTIRPTADRLGATLRADMIRTDTLTGLAAAMAQDADVRRELIDLLDELGAVVTGRAREGEADALVDDIESLADMGPATVDLTAGDLRQLRGEAWDAYDALAPVLRGVA